MMNMINMMNSRGRLSTVSFVCAFACVANEGPIDEQGENAGGRNSCVDSSTVMTADEVSPLGFAAAEIIATASGSHDSPIFWTAGTHDGPIDIEVRPESGEGTLTVTIAHEGGEIRYVDSEPAPSDENTNDGSWAECPDRVEIDVHVSARTGGGALDESFETTLEAKMPRHATFTYEVDLDALSGSFQVENGNPDIEVGQANLEVGVSEFGIHGSLSGQLSMSGDGWVGVGFVGYATFPRETPFCVSSEIPIPFDAAFDGFSAADALALIHQATGLRLTWEGKSMDAGLLLAAAYDGRDVCVAVDDSESEAGRLRFGGSVTLVTDDARVDAELPVEFTAMAGPDGALHQTSVQTVASYGNLVPVDEMEQRFGRFGVDLSGFDLGGVDFAGAFVDSEVAGSQDGHLVVLGGHAPMCSDEPGAPCEGVSYEEVAYATWSNAGG